MLTKFCAQRSTTARDTPRGVKRCNNILIYFNTLCFFSKLARHLH